MGCRVRRGDDFAEVEGPASAAARRRRRHERPARRRARARRGGALRGRPDAHPQRREPAHQGDRPPRRARDRAAASSAPTRAPAPTRSRSRRGPLRGAEIDTYDDHRMAMAFALAGLRVPGVAIRDPGCVSKTWPDYFSMLERCGLRDGSAAGRRRGARRRRRGRAADAPLRRTRRAWTPSTSRSRPTRPSACSAPTAPARPPSSAWSPASCCRAPGSVRVDGISPVERPRAVRERIGFVMETSRLYPELRVRGLPALRRRRARTRAARASPRRSSAPSRASGSPRCRGALIGNLSKGYQQRVSLAQAFLHDPALLIVDEPTGGLDPVQQDEVQSLLAGLTGTRTIAALHPRPRRGAAAGVARRRAAGRASGREGPTGEVLGGADPLALFRVARRRARDRAARAAAQGAGEPVRLADRLPHA